MPMPWYRVTLSLSQIKSGFDGKLIDSFMNCCGSARFPMGAGLYRSIGIMETVFYFSPAAAKIAMPLIQTFHGVLCEAPARSAVQDVCVQRGGQIPWKEEQGE